MATEGTCSGWSLDPLLFVSGNQGPLSQETSWCPTPHVVKIPCKMMLDLMLEELTLLKARYDFHADTSGRVTAVVTFYNSTRMPDNLLQAVKLGGAEALDYEAAEKSASREASRFVETWDNMEIEDLHYSELKYLEADMADLLGKLGVVRKEKESLQTALSLAAMRMVAFSNQIYGIACNSHFVGQCNAAEDINATIRLFEEVAADLGHDGKHLKKDLKKNRAFL